MDFFSRQWNSMSCLWLRQKRLLYLKWRALTGHFFLCYGRTCTCTQSNDRVKLIQISGIGEDLLFVKLNKLIPEDGVMASPSKVWPPAATEFHAQLSTQKSYHFGNQRMKEFYAVLLMLKTFEISDTKFVYCIQFSCCRAMNFWK